MLFQDFTSDQIFSVEWTLTVENIYKNTGEYSGVWVLLVSIYIFSPVTSWEIFVPSFKRTALNFALELFGEQMLYADDTNVYICWLYSIHLIVFVCLFFLSFVFGNFLPFVVVLFPSVQLTLSLICLFGKVNVVHWCFHCVYQLTHPSVFSLIIVDQPKCRDKRSDWWRVEHKQCHKARHHSVCVLSASPKRS